MINQHNDFQNEQHWRLLVLILKNIAEDKGITQQQIAAETGLHQSSVSRFFQAKFKPGLDVFLTIAKAVKVNFFFEDQESITDLNIIFEKAMEQLGRRPDRLPKN